MKKSLYGFKKSAMMGYKNFDMYMLVCGFTRSKEDHFVYLVFCVDDMLFIGKNKEIIQDVKT
jgi:hypothetical protein